MALEFVKHPYYKKTRESELFKFNEFDNKYITKDGEMVNIHSEAYLNQFPARRVE